MRRTTESYVDAVHARSIPLVLDLMNGRAPGVDGVSNTVHRLASVSLAVHPGRPSEAAAAGVRQGEELGVPRAAAGVVIRECGGRRAAAARPVVQG